MNRLVTDFAKEHPALKVSRGSSENWSRKRAVGRRSNWVASEPQTL
jgi:hypothetical protein